MALVAAPAAGQEPAAAQAPAAPEGKNSGSRIIVISDLAPDATENARLRASVYDAARGRGFEPAIGVDATGTAEKEGFVRGGVVTTDEHELDSLRHALGVAVLVRMSKDGQGARVTVVTDRGANTRQVQADAVEPTVGELIGQAPGAAAASAAGVSSTSAGASGTASSTTGEGSIVAGGLVLADQPGKPVSSNEVAEAWNARGGARLTYGARGLVTVQRTHNVAVVEPAASTPRGEDRTGNANADGIGGGIGAQVGLMYLPLPEDPTVSSGIIPAFRLGAGFDTNFLWVRFPEGFEWDTGPVGGRQRHVTYRDQGLWVANLIPHLGFLLGFGNYNDLNTWRGALVGLAWAPAVQYQLDMSKTPDEGKFRFNWAGLELSADLASIKTDEESDAQIRFSIYVLLPIDDDHPGMLSATIGAFWY